MTFRVDPTRLDLAAEFKANIYGRHSGDLQRILNAFRSEAQAGQYVLIREGRHGPWALAEYDPRPGQLPRRLGPSSKPRPRRNGPSSSCAGSGTPAKTSSSTERAHHAADHRLCRPHGGPARRNHRIQGELRGWRDLVSRPDPAPHLRRRPAGGSGLQGPARGGWRQWRLPRPPSANSRRLLHHCTAGPRPRPARELHPWRQYLADDSGGRGGADPDRPPPGRCRLRPRHRARRRSRLANRQSALRHGQGAARPAVVRGRGALRRRHRPRGSDPDAPRQLRPGRQRGPVSGRAHPANAHRRFPPGHGRRLQRQVRGPSPRRSRPRHGGAMGFLKGYRLRPESSIYRATACMARRSTCRPAA